MICEYCIVGDYFGFCQCSQRGDICPFMRRCSLEHKWLPLATMDKCNVRLENNAMSRLMKDEYKVLFESKGMLYVEYNDNVFKFSNPFDDVPEKVQLIKVDNELYIKGFESKIETRPEVEPAVELDTVEENKVKEKSSKKESKKKKRNK